MHRKAKKRVVLGWRPLVHRLHLHLTPLSPCESPDTSFWGVQSVRSIPSAYQPRPALISLQSRRRAECRGWGTLETQPASTFPNSLRFTLPDSFRFAESESDPASKYQLPFGNARQCTAESRRQKSFRSCNTRCGVSSTVDNDGDGWPSGYCLRLNGAPCLLLAVRRWCFKSFSWLTWP